VIIAVPGLGASFELSPLRWYDFLLIAAVVGVWGIVLRAAWRANLFERLLTPDMRSRAGEN
ncbi:MAG: hypothetical protein IT330_02425, partial [Anaerolineae bacterium]|nr:hypothetical protein [Anaerolineae bacterium]